MIDLHSHLLPNIDDGSRSAKQSARVLEHFAERGVSDVVLTPHLVASQAIGDPAERAVIKRAEALETLKASAPEKPKLHLGFEIMLDEPLGPLACGDRRLSLAGSRYFLVEFPSGIVPDLARSILERLAATGVIPLVAHPERYSGVTPAAVAGWRDVGAKVQVDATTLTYPTRRGSLAREIVAAGQADVLAADNHGGERTIATGADFLREAGATEVAEVLTSVNPAAVLADGEMVDAGGAALKRGWMDRFRKMMG